MYVRCTFFKAVPGKEEDVKRLYQEKVIPVLKKQQGLVDARLLEPADKADDFISMTEWISKAEADAYDNSGLYQQLVHKLDGLWAKAPVLKIYEVEQVAIPNL
jgi:quinol monooxygenase YgiN